MNAVAANNSSADLWGLKIADCLISATGSFTVSSSFKNLIDLLMVEENLVILR